MRSHPLAAVQMEYSLWTRDAEREILPALRELGIALVPYSPLGRGFLTGAFRSRDDLIPTDRRHAHPRFQSGNFEANLQLFAPLARIAERRGCATAQVALAWVLAQGDDIVPIPGTKRRTLAGAEHRRPGPVARRRANSPTLAEAFPAGAASGLRYPEKQLQGLGL